MKTQHKNETGNSASPRWLSRLKRVGLASTVAVAVLASGAAVASATHVDPDIDHGWMTCTGTEDVIATAYGTGWVQAIADDWNPNAVINSSNHNYYRYVTAGPADGSGYWSAESTTDLNPALSYGHCG